MSVEEIFQNWSHTQRIQVLELALPGIEGFLKDALQHEYLSEESEKLRRFYVKILENCSGKSEIEFNNSFGANKNDLSPEKTPPINRSRFSYNKEGTSEDKLLDRDDYSRESIGAKDAASYVPRQDRKGTDSAEESGVFFNSQFPPSVCQEVSNSRHSDTFESTSSRDTFLSESDFELLEWENESLINEDGYCTEDNYVQNILLEPNEFGEIFAGVLYIREQSGWHKRWFTITERCMKCYKHRKDDKMLFEIPLRDAKFVFTDLKRSRMFAITLSIAGLRDNMTFATTEGKTRQEWTYVINHVIKKLAENPHPESPIGNQNMPFGSLLQNDGFGEPQQENSSKDILELSKSDISEPQSGRLKRETWKTGSEKGLDEGMNEWRVKGEDENADVKTSLPPSLEQEKSFKELQECLPDILQRPKSKGWRGDVGNYYLPSSKKESQSARTIHSRKNITFNQDIENKLGSNSDLVSAPKVKRHGSLANSLTSKAARVRSKFTTSFFKKGKKEEKTYLEAGSQNTVFSGYLIRKKGNAWKNRWCVVKDHTLFCYKEFGATLAELELTLVGCGVNIVPEREREGEKSLMFVLTADKKQLYFAAENDAELEEWLLVLENEAKGADKEDSEINSYPTDSIDGMLTNLSSPDGPRDLSETQLPVEADDESKGATKQVNTFTRTTKEMSQVEGPAKRSSSLLGVIANRLGKHSSKSKESTNFKLSASAKIQLKPNEVENLAVSDQYQSDVDGNLTEIGPTKEGSLYHRRGNDWLRSKVRLYNHSIDIDTQDDSIGGKFYEVIKFRLVNCIVLDCIDTEGPLVMVIKRNIGQPLYLQADNEDDYIAWKEAISSSLLTIPSTMDRLRSIENGGDDDESWRTTTPNSSKISGDSFDREDVFFKDYPVSDNQFSDAHPSPRASTAGDVSSEGSVDDHQNKPRARVERAYSAGGIDRLRSLSEGYLIHSKKRQSPLRRTISNALTSLDLSPKKRRRKTFSGLGINASLLIGIKYTSCLYLHNSKGLWSKRWCVLQQNSLHLFKGSEDISPSCTIELEGCSVQKKTFKGKKFAFALEIPSAKTEYFLAAENERELMIWMDLFLAEGDMKGHREGPVINFDLLNGVLPKIKSEGNVDISSRPDVAAVDSERDDSKKKNVILKTSRSLVELQKIRKGKDKQLVKDSSGNTISSSSIITHRPTSLQEVLLLLQEQQLMQSMGHQRYIRVKKARGNWKKSAAAVLKDAVSQAESPELITKQSEVKERNETSETGPQEKPRGSSVGSSNSDYANALSFCQTSEDYMGKCDKLAEEEKLKALKAETLLRKRRNSLNLEKGVLQKKLEKTNERKGTVKKLLGKEVVTAKKNKDEIIRDQKRLEEINLKLAHVDQNMRENKSKELAVMENIIALKTNPRPRRASDICDSARNSTSESTTRSVHEEIRARFRESPTGSLSSRDSFDDKNEPYRFSLPERAASLHYKGSKKTCQASLLALEEELQKISPNVTKRKKYGSEKRVSLSSEGSFEESFLKDSPETSRRSSTPPAEKRESISSLGSTHSQDSTYGLGEFHLKRKRHSGPLPTSEKSGLRTVSVPIPSSSGVNDVGATSLPINSEHRPSLITALSQIKDFEEFLESIKPR